MLSYLSHLSRWDYRPVTPRPVSNPWSLTLIRLCVIVCMQKGLLATFLLFICEYLSFFCLILLSAGITVWAPHRLCIWIFKISEFCWNIFTKTFYALPHPVSEVSFKACCRILKSRGCHTALVPDSNLSLSHCQSLHGVLSPRALQAPLEGSLVMVLGVSPEALNEFIQHMTENLLPLGPTGSLVLSPCLPSFTSL